MSAAAAHVARADGDGDALREAGARIRELEEKLTGALSALNATHARNENLLERVHALEREAAGDLRGVVRSMREADGKLRAVADAAEGKLGGKDVNVDALLAASEGAAPGDNSPSSVGVDDALRVCDAVHETADRLSGLMSEYCALSQSHSDCNVQ